MDTHSGLFICSDSQKALHTPGARWAVGEVMQDLGNAPARHSQGYRPQTRGTAGTGWPAGTGALSTAPVPPGRPQRGAALPMRGTEHFREPKTTERPRTPAKTPLGAGKALRPGRSGIVPEVQEKYRSLQSPTSAPNTPAPPAQRPEQDALV